MQSDTLQFIFIDNGDFRSVSTTLDILTFFFLLHVFFNLTLLHDCPHVSFIPAISTDEDNLAILLGLLQHSNTVDRISVVIKVRDCIRRLLLNLAVIEGLIAHARRLIEGLEA